MTNQDFKAYRDLVKQLELLETQKEALKAKLITSMQQSDVKRVKNRYGLFSIGERTNYIYSPKIAALETKVSHMKEIERVTGTAEVASVTPFIRYQA